MAARQRILLALGIAAAIAVGGCKGMSGASAAASPKAVPVGKPKPPAPLVKLASSHAQPPGKVAEAMETRVTADLVNTPIQDVVALMADVCQVNMVLDRNAVPAEGAAITLRLTGVPLKAALAFVLKQAMLKYAIRNEALYISNEEGLRRAPVMQVYDVRDLLRAADALPGGASKPGGATVQTAGGQLAERAMDLVELIVNVVEPEGWGATFVAGTKSDSRKARCVNIWGTAQPPFRGEGLVAYREGALIVIQPPETHQRIEELLTRLHQHQGLSRPVWATPAIQRQEGNGERKIRKGLEKPVTLDFAGTPIEDAVRFMADYAGIDIVLDKNAVPAEGACIRLKVKDMPLKVALDFVLRPAQLGYDIRNEALFISNKEGLCGEFVMRVYDVRELVGAVEVPPGAAQSADGREPRKQDALDGATDLVELMLTIVSPESWGAAVVAGWSEAEEHAPGAGGLKISGSEPPSTGIGSDRPINVPTHQTGGIGEGRIAYRDGALVVVQPPEIHQQIEELFKLLREHQAASAKRAK